MPFFLRQCATQCVSPCGRPRTAFPRPPHEKYCDGAPPYACAAAPRLREAFPAPRPSRGASWDMQMYVDARTGEDGSSAAVVG